LQVATDKRQNGSIDQAQISGGALFDPMEGL